MKTKNKRAASKELTKKKLKFTVSVSRTRYYADVEELSKSIQDNDGYFYTKWGVMFYSEDNDCISYITFTTQYDEVPDVIDVANAISEYFNSIFLYFAKYGEEVKTKRKKSK